MSTSRLAPISAAFGLLVAPWSFAFAADATAPAMHFGVNILANGDFSHADAQDP